MDADEKAARKRASKLRGKQRKGRTLSAEDQALVDAYPKQAAGRPTKGETPAPDRGDRLEVDGPPGAPRDAAASAPDDAGPGIAPEFAAAAGETPAPDAPRVKPRAEGKRAGKTGGWRDKHRAGASDGEREATCTEVAELWMSGLRKMNASIVAHGGRPAFPDSMLVDMRGCFVLTVDKLLPADVVIGPEIQASVVSTVVTSQCWWTIRKAKQAATTQGARTRRDAEYTNPNAATTEPEQATESRPLAIVRTPSRKLDENSVY